MPTQIINGTAGAKHATNGPLTTTTTREASPSLLQNEIDSRIVKIRPSATPIDQISRMAATRRAGAMVVDYYSVDTRPTNAGTTGPATLTAGKVVQLNTTANEIFDATETILLPEVTNAAGEKAVLYVTGREPGEAPSVIAVNLADDEELSIAPGSLMVRMGRAAGELDVQTPSFEALPVKSSNNCQIFK